MNIDNTNSHQLSDIGMLNVCRLNCKFLFRDTTVSIDSTIKNNVMQHSAREDTCKMYQASIS